MQVKIIKGINQIGGCITEIKYKDTRIIIDFGDELDEKQDTFGLDGLTYGIPKYHAVFITHSHGDHIGLIDKILESIPVFVEEKSLEIHNLTCDFCGKERIKRNINVFKLPKTIESVKPIYENRDLKVTPYIIDHSSFNSCMYLIEGDQERILHTGDFRNHGRKKYLFDKVLKNIGKVDLLITEGTALTRCKEKYIEEVDLERKAKEIMNNYDQVFIMQSSTNIDRTTSFLKASLQSNKKFVLDLFSYYLNQRINFNINVDYKKVFVWKPYKYKDRPDWFKDKYLDIETSANIFPKFSMEVKESMVPDIKMLYKKGILKNACFIYSMWDGYIKKEEKLQKFIEELYGSEVQQAIDNALIYLPEEVALKAYRDEVLTKNQTIAYTPVGPYNPATKLYVDESNDATNQRLDDEIARATAAEKNLNEKHVLTWADNSYKYLDLKDISSDTQALVDENALDQKLAELSLGFFVFYQVKEDGTLVEESKDDSGSNPYSVVATSADLPTTDVPTDALALVLKDDTNVDVYKYDGTSWSVLATPVIENGWLFAEESTGHGFYWFQNTWNKVDMNVDMSEYYKKTEIDSILTGYVTNTTLGALTDLTTSDKTTIVAAINSLKTLTDTKDTLPEINDHCVLANRTNAIAKPTEVLRYADGVLNSTLALRTTTGTLKAKDATADDELTTLKQVNDLIDNMDISGYQPLIAAGTANDIIAYSGTAGTLNTLTRATTINATLASTSDTKIPTEKGVATYVQNYKPVIVTQGSSNTNVTTNQLTFWIES